MKAKLLLLLFLATFSIYAQTNLVPNGGFEDWTGTGSTFTDWTTTNFVTNSFDVAQGIQSARLVYQSTSPKITTQVPMKAGVTYTIKYKYKYLSANYDGTHPIALNISKAGASATLSNSTFATNNLWTEKETTFTADKDLSYDLSISTFSFDNASFEVLIDAIQVYVQGTEQFTQIPNLNFEKKLIALGLDSGTPDGQVPTININTIKYLDISRSSISDLTGLEDFTSLTSLDCSQSGLTSLDLSKNPNLLRLNCSFNNGLTNFDASTNPNLVFLDCSYNNLLTLNLTGNPALQYLEATSNYLTTLDLSNNTNLLELQLRSNRLASIDLSKNTALKQASLLSNLLTSLNVSSNTALEVLDVGSNKLTSIDLSKNKLLKDLTLYGNQLTSLDLSANNALIMLNCSSNKLTGLNLKNGNNSNFVLDHSIGYMDIRGTYGSLVYSSSFASNPLSCIQVDDTDYSNTNWSKIKDNDTNYTSLDCSLSTLIPDSKFEDELITLGIDLDGRNGAVLNSSIKNVTTLNVSGKGITNLAGIEGFTGLTSLNVSDNTLKRLNLSKNTLLTTLNTFNNPTLTCVEVPDLTLASTWAVTKDATTSFSLDCNVYTLIPDPKFEEFLISKNYDKDGLNGKVLTENIDKITILNMNSLGISDLTGIQDFASLIFLQAYGNQIETIDVSKNKALTNLDLDNNKLTKIDLSNNTALISVDLTNNLISEIDLTNNLNLKNLQIGGNKLSKIDLSANTKLTYILANNNKLTSFDISNNPDVFQVWCQNNQIRSLDFSKNSKLVQILAENNKLVNLNFKNGANTLIDVSSGNNGGIRFAGNPDLKCIQVDDVAYSDANWSAKKDATATFSSAACPVVIPYTLIPDANFEAKLIALGIDKDGIAGKVETMNIVNLTSLNLANTGIADLRGIEDFAALTSLDVSNNKLTTIDVSKNIDLKTLNVSRNQLTSLNVSTNNSLNTLNCATNAIADLDVTRNTELSSLSCNSNAITRLDVARNTKLTVLNASFNKLQYLDVSKNALLKEVDAASNDLYNLNLKNGNNANMQRMIFGNFTQNPHLVCIEVDDVAFSEANWIAKDATASYSFQACPLNEQQTLIPDPAFERILIAKGIDTDGENGKVRTASISGLTNLTLNDSDNKVSDLTGIQDFKSLLTLEANRNNLKTIDLSQNTALRVLYLIDNQLTDIDLSNNPLLWSLDVNGNELTNLDLSKNTKLMHLSASYNKLTDINLSLNTQLTALSIDSNLLTSLDVSNNVLLTQILCSYNKIGTLDLSKNTKLVYINASDNKLYNVNIKNGANNLVNTSVYASFIDNPYLKCIQVDDVDFSNTNWSKMKDAAVVYSSDACPDVEPFTLIPDVNFENKLIALGIDKDGPNGKVATYSIDSVTSLNVSKSDISDLTGLQDFKALTSLEAAENKLTTINVSNNTLLTNLNVSKNQLTSLNTSTNYRLLTLNCSANSIAALDLTENRSLSDLNCSKNAIAALDLSNLSDLTNLNCSTNALTALNVSRNKKLTVLSTSINKLENLDVSRNTALKEIDCADNELYNLNLQNGNNVNMERVIFGNFTQNPNLLCIQVDDAAFSNDKWIAKDATATYSSEACPLNGKYTLIPDPNFEKILIAKKIDIDGENGKVLTSRIESVTYLDVTDSTLKISDLTGIQDFKNLSTLYCSSANLTSLDLSKNVNLEVVNFSNNKLTSIDLSANTNLTSVAAYNNELTSLDLSKNTALKTLTVYGNVLTSLNISKNTALTSLDADNNQLSTLDISANTNLTKINLYNNQLTSLDFSKNPLLKEIRITSNKIENINVSNLNALTSLVANNNQLSTIDVSRNTGLLSLEVSNNKLTAINVSLNTSLTALGVSKNQLKTLDITKNTALVGLLANDNQLTSLDLRNGKNTLMQNYNLSFTGNPQLYCILVDDVSYSNTNWSSNKDAVAKYNTECTGELVLASNNFTVETKGESCLGENNGEISIVGKASFAYNAMINDKPYTFTDNALKVTALTPGVYKIKITIPEMIFEQNFNITIQKGATITGKSSVSAKNVEVEITEGTAPFTVFIDGAEQFQTTDKNFTVSLDKAALVEVATAKACEGVFAKKVTSYELGTMLAAYPNPTTGTIEIEIPSTKTEIAIELYNFGGQLVSYGTYNIESGKALLNLEKLPSGIYAAKINLDTPEYIKIIKK